MENFLKQFWKEVFIEWKFSNVILYGDKNFIKMVHAIKMKNLGIYNGIILFPGELHFLMYSLMPNSSFLKLTNFLASMFYLFS